MFKNCLALTLILSTPTCAYKRVAVDYHERARCVRNPYRVPKPLARRFVDRGAGVLQK